MESKKGAYEFLPHTADAKFLAYGKDIEEAFCNAAKAMMSIIVDEDRLEEKKTRKIRVTGRDEKALLYNFLEELIFLLDAEFFCAKSFKDLKIMQDGKTKEFSLETVLSGQTLDDSVETEEHVKAATYNDMEIKKTKGKVVLQVVLDL